MKIRILMVGLLWVLADAAFGATEAQPMLLEEDSAFVVDEHPATNAKTQSTTVANGSAGTKQIESAGQIVWAKGMITATYPEQSSRILERGSPLYEKDTVVTDDSSSGEISFTDNSIVSLRPSTTFVIEQYHFDEKKPSSAAGQYIMNLVKGGFRTITGFVAKAKPENYKVKTPIATIGVRGTTYQMNCENGKCGVGLEKGTGVTISNQTGNYVLTPRTRYAFIPGANVRPIFSESLPAILSKTPIMTEMSGPLPTGINPPPKVGGGGGCGILIQ